MGAALRSGLVIIAGMRSVAARAPYRWSRRQKLGSAELAGEALSGTTIRSSRRAAPRSLRGLRRIFGYRRGRNDVLPWRRWR